MSVQPLEGNRRAGRMLDCYNKNFKYTGSQPYFSSPQTWVNKNAHTHVYVCVCIHTYQHMHECGFSLFVKNLTPRLHIQSTALSFFWSLRRKKKECVIIDSMFTPPLFAVENHFPFSPELKQHILYRAINGINSDWSLDRQWHDFVVLPQQGSSREQI